MALSDEQRAVGREGMIDVEGVEISVIIRDVRLRPTAVDYLIEPTAGKGKVWVDADRIRVVGWSV